MFFCYSFDVHGISSDESSFNSNVCNFFHFIIVRLTRVLLILLIFPKNQHFVSFIFLYSFPVFNSLICTLLFINLFLLFFLGWNYSSFYYFLRILISEFYFFSNICISCIYFPQSTVFAASHIFLIICAFISLNSQYIFLFFLGLLRF